MGHPSTSTGTVTSGHEEATWSWCAMFITPGATGSSSLYEADGNVCDNGRSHTME